jgi:hypothetical protein
MTVIIADKPPLVPEALIVFLLKHSSAFEWVCINCRCDAQLVGGSCTTPQGKWQQAQGETGLDIVGRLTTPRHRWFLGLDATCTTVILEAKGDRAKDGGARSTDPLTTR